MRDIGVSANPDKSTPVRSPPTRAISGILRHQRTHNFCVIVDRRGGAMPIRQHLRATISGLEGTRGRPCRRPSYIFANSEKNCAPGTAPSASTCSAVGFPRTENSTESTKDMRLPMNSP